MQGKIHIQQNWNEDIWTLLRLSFKELHDSKLPGVDVFNNSTISLSLKRGKNQQGRLWVHETTILEIIFVIFTENSYVVTNDTYGLEKYPRHLK